MAHTNKIKLNVFDFFILGFILLFLALLVISFYWPKPKLSGKATLGIKIIEEQEILKDKVKVGEIVFLNGSNNPSRIKRVKVEGDSLVVFISGPAAQKGEVYNFNGQRVLIGQKAELHGSFFARGIVASFNLDHE